MNKQRLVELGFMGPVEPVQEPPVPRASYAQVLKYGKPAAHAALVESAQKLPTARLHNGAAVASATVGANVPVQATVLFSKASPAAADKPAHVVVNRDLPAQKNPAAGYGAAAKPIHKKRRQTAANAKAASGIGGAAAAAAAVPVTAVSASGAGKSRLRRAQELAAPQHQAAVQHARSYQPVRSQHPLADISDDSSMEDDTFALDAPASNAHMFQSPPSAARRAGGARPVFGQPDDPSSNTSDFDAADSPSAVQSDRGQKRAPAYSSPQSRSAKRLAVPDPSRSYQPVRSQHPLSLAEMTDDSSMEEDSIAADPPASTAAHPELAARIRAAAARLTREQVMDLFKYVPRTAHACL